MSESGKTSDVDSVHIWTLVGVSLLTFVIFVLLAFGVLRIFEMGQKALLAGAILLVALASCVYFVCKHRVADCLWMFVWSWGTALALFIPITANNTNTMLAELTPRLFVVWFLSLLTMVATLLLARMTRLAATQDALRKLLDAAEAWNKKTELSFDETHKKIDEMQDHARNAIRTAASAVNVVERYVGVQDLEQKIRRVQAREQAVTNTAAHQHVHPTQSFLEAANKRLEVIAEIGERVRERVERAVELAEGGTIAEKAQAFLISNVLLPSFLPYLGSDPWHKSEGKLAASVIQDGSYLQYARLIEAVFREGSRCIDEFGKSFPGFSIEMFTTLNIYPRRLLNAIDGTPIADAYEKEARELDVARTSVAWEHYRAVQAYAVKKGRASGLLALTRCFVTKTADEQKMLQYELTRAFLGRESTTAFDALARKLEAPLPGAKPEDYLKLSEAEVKLCLEPLKVSGWSEGKLKSLGFSTIPRHDGDGCFAHKIAMCGYRQELSIDLKKEWRPVISECLWRYFSSPARALWAHSETLRLPQDIFVVGVAEKSEVVSCPRAIKPACVITLDTTEGGTITVTNVLFPGDTQEIGPGATNPLTFEAIEQLVNEILGQQPRAGLRVWPVMESLDVGKLLAWEDEPAFREFLDSKAALPAK